jgi:hypothetical protein
MKRRQQQANSPKLSIRPEKDPSTMASAGKNNKSQAAITTHHLFSFITSFATIVVTCIRIGCLVPKEWLPAKVTSSASSSSVISWLLYQSTDMAPFWTSILIRPFETWGHVREARAVRNLFGSQFQDAYQGSYVHLPPLVLAAFDHVLDYDPYDLVVWKPLAIGVVTHLLDLWIAAKFLRLGNCVLQEMRDSWEDALQPRVPESLRPPQAHIFALSNEDMAYTNEIPPNKLPSTSNAAEESKTDTKQASVEDSIPVAPIFTFSDLPLLAAQIYYYSPFTALAAGLGTTHQCFQNLWLFFLLQGLHEACHVRPSVSLTAFWLALGSYMELHYVAFLIPCSLWIQRRSKNNSQPNKVYCE